jgi:hypothetical protein
MRAPIAEIPVELQAGELETRGTEWGDLSVRHCDLPAGADLRPLLKGLPDDRCSCPHWGFVFSGSIHLRYADGTEEVTNAGEAFYWPGGHTGWTDEGVVFVEFSPAAEIKPVLEHLAQQLTGGD